ncbi:uncharacterized protein LOC141686857 [Apium graveolens]|uniref:uncharacterized protein LOC141686857 n=1 Tax=Apium graveolens TaxID=4045 RepID=UPI003D791F09
MRLFLSVTRSSLRWWIMSPILQIDMVWCYFMLRDMSWLSLAGVRLAKSRVGIERAHGKESSRVRIFQRGRCPELPLYLRMDILEGVVAYHSQQLKKSKAFLNIVKYRIFITRPILYCNSLFRTIDVFVQTRLFCLLI